MSAITGTYDVRKDANLDGTVDFLDITHASNVAGGGYVTTGRGVLGSTANQNRFGYGAYLRDPAVPQWHVRFRLFRSDIGRWLTRDPAGYVDGPNLYQYVGSRASGAIDPFGLQYWPPEPIPGEDSPYPVEEPGWPQYIWPGLSPYQRWLEEHDDPSQGLRLTREEAQGLLDLLGCFDPTPACDGTNAAMYADDGEWGQVRRRLKALHCAVPRLGLPFP